MVETALQEFWRLLGLQSLPANEHDQTVEIDGIGKILVARRGSHVSLSGFVPSHPGHHDGIAPLVLGLADYRSRSGARNLHPVVSTSGDWGLLAVLQEESLSGHGILQAFENLCSALERIENRMKA
jgi:hypothetical protein